MREWSGHHATLSERVVVAFQLIARAVPSLCDARTWTRDWLATSQISRDFTSVSSTSMASGKCSGTNDTTQRLYVSSQHPRATPKGSQCCRSRCVRWTADWFEILLCGPVSAFALPSRSPLPRCLEAHRVTCVCGPVDVVRHPL